LRIDRINGGGRQNWRIRVGHDKPGTRPKMGTTPIGSRPMAWTWVRLGDKHTPLWVWGMFLHVERHVSVFVHRFRALNVDNSY
jgi:hypothetical protein